jgi:hypothetical protein
MDATLFALASASSNEHSLLKKVDVATVKSLLRFAEGKLWKEHEHTRTYMLKYLENKNAVGEGNEWLHADDVKWSKVSEEAYEECYHAYRSCLKSCVSVLFMEQEGKSK